jgi:hypothetical protein
MKLTEWFPAHIKPVHVGWYDARWSVLRWFWDGERWKWRTSDGVWICPLTKINGWRGIAGCEKCGSEMKPGKAIAQTYTGAKDMGEVCTISPGGNGKLIDCQKCSKCGWSTK